jgi:trk system potassium uptake protein
MQHIVIYGTTLIAESLAEILNSYPNIGITIVDENVDKLSDFAERFDANTVTGPGASLTILKKAEVAGSIFIAVSNSDEMNLSAAMIASKLEASRIVAIISRKDFFEGQRSFYMGLMDIDLVINQDYLAAQELNKLITSRGTIALEQFAEGRISLMQLKVEKRPNVVGIPLSKLQIPSGTLIGSILRKGKIIIPRGDDTLLEGDEVFAIAEPGQSSKVVNAIGNPQPPLKWVVVIGGGGIGSTIASSLERQGIATTVIEVSEERCVELSNQYSKVEVIHGDGTDLDLLKELNINRCDAFITVTRNDEHNLLSALLASSLGAKFTIVLARRPDFIPIYENLGINAVASPRQFTSEAIMKFILDDESMPVAILEDGKAEVIEMIATHFARITNRPLKEIKVPKGALIGAIVHENNVIIPRGDTVIPHDSSVIIFTTPEAKEAVIDLFR